MQQLHPVLTITSCTSILEEIGDFGAAVADRGGAIRRTSEQRESYCLRHFLFASNEVGKLNLPVRVSRPLADNGQPDFVLEWPQLGTELGIEITEAGSEDWQQELTESSHPDLDDNSGFVRFLPRDGYIGQEPERLAVEDVKSAIESKLTKLAQGNYSAVEQCDLLIYLNSEGHVVSDHAEFVRMLRVVLIGWQDIKKPFFRSIHTLSDRFADLDLTLRSYRRVDIRKYLPPTAVAAE